MIQKELIAFFKEVGAADIAMTRADFDDLVTLHLCDWLEQVARWGNWDYRRAAFERMARRGTPQTGPPSNGSNCVRSVR